MLLNNLFQSADATRTNKTTHFSAFGCLDFSSKKHENLICDENSSTKVDAIHMKAKWFQTQIPFWNRDK